VVFLTAFFYRFNTLGGAFGGFTNDQFGYLSRARQIQGGEVPFRDFNDPGWFLTDGLSAAAQWLGGYNLRSEALLTVGMLSLGAAITFLLARRLSGSVVAALVAVGLHIAFDPRHYNYPKIVLYATGLALAWAYAERPGSGKRVALGVLVGIGFLLRHDHLVYLGALSLMTMALAHRSSLREGVRAAAVVCGAAAALVVPFFGFLALSGGVGEYFRTALVYVSRDAQRTSFTLPRLSLDLSKPLIAVSRAVSPSPRINVRWNPVSDADRRRREDLWGLSGGERLEGSTWAYELGDTASANIEALVRDPLVDDTQGLDRTNFTLAGDNRPLRLNSQFDSVQNATAFLYYFIVLLPFAGGVVLWRLRRAHVAGRVFLHSTHLVPLLVLAGILNVSFLSRGSTNIRIADVGVTTAVILAWLLAAVLGPDGRSLVRHRGARVALRAVAVMVLCVTMLSANGLAQGTRALSDAGFTGGPLELVRRAGLVWNRLGTHPSTFTMDQEQPSILRVARFVNACTSPDDRLFVLGEHPELYYFSDRLFAGGHAWLLPGYYSGDADEVRIIARLKAVSVPIVLTESGSVYAEDYRPVFEQVDRYLEDEYVDAGEIEVWGSRPLHVFVRADRTPTRRYEPLGLPCFAP
jgi:hypothetical protein